MGDVIDLHERNPLRDKKDIWVFWLSQNERRRQMSRANKRLAHWAHVEWTYREVMGFLTNNPSDVPRREPPTSAS